MIVGLIDNGSLQPAAHRNLRTLAAALSQRTGVHVRAVSWKHSDRIAPELLNDTPAWTLDRFVRSFHALGQRDFVFVPFFISPQGAIGSALRDELDDLRRVLEGLEFRFTDGLAAAGALPGILASRIRDTIARHGLHRPPVVVVDHGGPSAASATLRDEVTAALRQQLPAVIGPVAAASMEGAHPPLLAEQLREPAFAGRDVVVAPLFLSPGRHAGPDGDIARICRAANPRARVADLVGTHPAVIDQLAAALQPAATTLHAQPFA